VVVSFLAGAGILMAAISPLIIAGLLVFVFLYLVGMDYIKVWFFKFASAR